MNTKAPIRAEGLSYLNRSATIKATANRTSQQADNVYEAIERE